MQLTFLPCNNWKIEPETLKRDIDMSVERMKPVKELQIPVITVCQPTVGYGLGLVDTWVNCNKSSDFYTKSECEQNHIRK